MSSYGAMAARLAAALCLCVLTLPAVLAQPCQGAFRVMGDIGISPITVSQSKDGKLYLMDRRDLQNSKIVLPDGTYGHAVEYTPSSNTWRTITTATNTWCSAGGYLPDGTILNTAGNDAGLRAVRALLPCSVRNPRKFVGNVGPTRCNEWWEDATKLQLGSKRWYPTQQVLPDGRHILIGGSFGGVSTANIIANYEFLDPYKVQTGALIDMPFLREGIPNYLYPFVHLLPSDYLFIFANVAGIIFNYKTNAIVRRVPRIPDGISRSYPNTAASLLLPLDHKVGFQRAEILICGGNAVTAGSRTVASRTCWLVDVTKGKIDTNTIGWKGPYLLARPRVMPDLFFLMDGSYAIINGAQQGVAGFNSASVGNYVPEILKRNAAGGIDINSNLCPSTIVRGYHASAILIPDGRVFICGSNAWGRYTTRAGDPFSTEYRIEMWTPPYLQQPALPKPIIQAFPATLGYNKAFTVTVSFTRTPSPTPTYGNMRVAFISNTFVTHSMSMHLRYINVPFTVVGNTITAKSPPNNVIAPSGPYMLAVSYLNNPSTAVWVTIA